MADVLQRTRRRLRRARRQIDSLSMWRRGQPLYEPRLTAAGRRREAMLLQIAGFIGDNADWSLDRVDASEGLIEFLDGSRRLVVELSAATPRDQAYARTRYFNVGHRALPDFGDSDLAFLDQVVEGIGKAETALGDTDDFPNVLLAKAAAEIIPRPADSALDLRPSLACNHRCPFCNSVDRRLTDSTMAGIDDILANLDELEPLKLETVTISGGEPTLLRDLPELIGALADRGYRTEVQTHGMALGEGLAQRLADAGLNRVLVSLHSADAAVSDGRITMYEGAWVRTVAGIDAALAAGIRVHISHVVHAANHDGTEAFFRFVSDRWGRRVETRLAFVAPTGHAADDDDTSIPSLTEVLPHLVPALGYARRCRLRVTIVGYCGIPPCLVRPHERLCEVVTRRATEYPDSHTKLDACRGCRYERSCPGIWDGYYQRHGDPGLAAIH